MIILKCPKCGSDVDLDDSFCKKCGTSLDANKYCTKCGAELEEDSKFCDKCGAKVGALASDDNDSKPINFSKYSKKNDATKEEKESKLKNLTSGKKALGIIAVFAVILIACYFAGIFSSEVELNGEGFSATMPKGYSMIEDKYMVAGGNTVPLYRIYDNEGTSVLNITYIPSRFSDMHNSSDIRDYMKSENFSDIKKVKLGTANGYKGTDNFFAFKGHKIAYVTLDGSDYVYRIKYLNERNLSYLNDTNFTDFNLEANVTEPDDSITYNETDTAELQTGSLTLTAPKDWTISQHEQSGTNRYDVLTENGTSRMTILDVDIEMDTDSLSGSTLDIVYSGMVDSLNANDVKSYTIDGIEGRSINTDDMGYLIIAIKGRHAYSIMYSDEESLAIANTIDFK